MHSGDFIFQNFEREMFYKLLFVLNLQIFRQSFFAAIFWSVPGSLVIKKFKTWKVSKFAASVFPPLPTSDTRKLSFPSNLWIRGENNTEMIRSIYRRGGNWSRVHFFFCRKILPRKSEKKGDKTRNWDIWSQLRDILVSAYGGILSKVIPYSSSPLHHIRLRITD